jgi:bifunctional polynucleotide phosphatase/kinase
LKEFADCTRCVPHTLQLAVKDCLKKFSTEIDKIRLVARKLRTPSYRNILARNKISKVQLDCEPRWSSQYVMAASICKNLDFFIDLQNDHPEIQFDSGFLKSFVKVLEPAFNCTKKLQYEQLTLGDFYLYWLEMKFELRKENSVLARELLTQIETREPNLIASKSFLAALFMDQRFNFKNSRLSIFTRENKNIARVSLIRFVIFYC